MQRIAYAVTHPTIAIGTIRAAYSLKPMPAYSATIRFMGLEITSGATPAAEKTANANGMMRSGRCG